MYDIILILWILIFFILLVVNIVEKSHWFGIFAGIWLLLLGLAIIITGVQIQNGMSIETSGAWQNITFLYEDLAPPFYPYGGVQSTYSLVWGVIFILISIYITYSNAEETF